MKSHKRKFKKIQLWYKDMKLWLVQKSAIGISSFNEF